MPALNGYREEGRMGAWCKIGGSLPSLRWFRSPFRLLVRFSSSSEERERERARWAQPADQLHLDLQSEDDAHPNWTDHTGSLKAGNELSCIDWKIQVHFILFVKE